MQPRSKGKAADVLFWSSGSKAQASFARLESQSRINAADVLYAKTAHSGLELAISVTVPIKDRDTSDKRARSSRFDTAEKFEKNGLQERPSRLPYI